MSKETQSWQAKISPKDRIYYTRIVFAVVAAFLCLIFNLSGPIGILGFILGIAVIVLSYFIAVFFLRVNPKDIGGHARGLVNGLGTSILLFLIIWFLIFNFLIVVPI